MFIVIAIVVGIATCVALYNHDNYGRSNAGACVLSGFLVALFLAAMMLFPCAVAPERFSGVAINTTYTELIPLSHIYPDEYKENEYVIFKEGKYCFYVKNEDGVIDYKQTFGVNEIRFNKDEPIAYVFEERDFKDALADTLYPKSLCNNYYYLNLPEGSEIIYVVVEGGK